LPAWSLSLFPVNMKAFLTLLPLSIALLASASPLGDRALFARHSGVPLSRRYMISSNMNAPSSCMPSNLPQSIPNNYSGSPFPPDNSTDIPPPSEDGPIIINDNSTLPDANSTSSDNSTISKRWGYSDFSSSWNDLCTSVGSFDDSDTCFTYGDQCEEALSADADVCSQQEWADNMITFVKSSGFENWQDFVNLAVSYRKLPRESVEILGMYPSTPYCNQSPYNSELYGIWQEQPEGVTVGLYGGPSYPIAPFGGDESCPFGQFANVVTCECAENFYTPNAGFPGTPNMGPLSVASLPTATDSAAPSNQTDSASDDTDDTDSTDDSDTDDSDDTDSSSASATASSDASSATATDDNSRRRKRRNAAAWFAEVVSV